MTELKPALIDFLNNSYRPLAKLHSIADVMYATPSDSEVCPGTIHDLGDALLDYISELENRRKELNTALAASEKK